MGPIYEYPLMGFEPAISRVMLWSPSRIVGSGSAGEVASADGVCSARTCAARTEDAGTGARRVLPIANAEPVAATESPKRNSLRPIVCASCISESMLLS